MFLKIILKSVFFLFISSLSFASEFDEPRNSQMTDDQIINDAIGSTQDVMTNTSKRNTYLKSSPKAQQVDKQIKSLTGGDDIQNEKIYGISAEALSSLMKDANNDPGKAAEILKQAEKNPEAFYNSLPENIKNQIRNVSAQIDKKKNSHSVP